MRDTEQLHDDACRNDVPGYMDPGSGLFVMTSAYLRRRGFCCGNACRHCPYLGTAGEHPERSTNAEANAADRHRGQP